MSRLAKMLIVFAWVAFVPAAAYAQGSIVGLVKDASGAVLPGVTVEAASPALIEKVRSVVSDGTGQYRIENLRPGLYTVTFTLPGFATVRREGIELTGAFSATVNADLRVGAVAETVTVTGETPVVDIQNTARERVIDHQILDNIPSGRTEYNLGVLIPGVTLNGGQDVGGSGGQTAFPDLGIHGSKPSDVVQTLGGMSISVLTTGSHQPVRVNPAGTEEITMDTAAADAEYAVGGVRVNRIPRDGGNTFSGTFFGSFANSSMQGSNFTQDLRKRGLGSTESINKIWDANPGFGGPLKRDRLWFYSAYMHRESSVYAAGLFWNRNVNNPNAWTFDPDFSRPAANERPQTDGQVHLTWQATPRNKIGVTWQEAVLCFCPQRASVTSALETAEERDYPLRRIGQVSWTTPITSRLLVEASGGEVSSISNQFPQPWLEPGMIPVAEQSTGLNYRSGDPYRGRSERVLSFRGAVAYITGAHAFKVGIGHRSGRENEHRFDNSPLSFRFNNGVPNQLTERALPIDRSTHVDHDMGVFAQDKWTIRGLTLAYGLRYDHFANSFPEQQVGPARLAPTRNITFPAQAGSTYHDITPRLGVSYDPFGSGKTAIKVSLNKYLTALGSGGLTSGGSTNPGGGSINPADNLIDSTSRSWIDANRNFVPDCDLINPNANGECGRMTNISFGGVRAGTAYDPDLLRGWGRRNYNWEFSAGVQQELRPRVAAEVGYFRRAYGNFAVRDNQAVDPTDFDSFSITAPVDPRLPGGGGYLVSGLYDLKPAKFGVPADNFVTRAENYGKQVEYWQGVDVTLNARPRQGLLLQGGFSTGRTVTDNCEIVAKLPEMLVATANSVTSLPLAANNVWTPQQYCHQMTAFLTQVKFLGSYTIPRADVQVSGTFQSLPGPHVLANYNAPNALVRQSLGRDLSAGANQNLSVNILEPGVLNGERLNQLDLRVAKILRFGRTRTSVGLDFFNALNSNAVLAQNNNFGAWQQPTEILLARFVKLNMQFDF